MAEIVGTITNLSDFLSKTQVCLSVKPNDPQQQIICLEADRKYSIPAFQREVRWDDNNLKMLLYDLSRSSKFLGNIKRSVSTFRAKKTKCLIWTACGENYIARSIPINGAMPSRRSRQTIFAQNIYEGVRTCD